MATVERRWSLFGQRYLDRGILKGPESSSALLKDIFAMSKEAAELPV